MAITVANAVRFALALKFLKVLVSPAKHPDGKGELEVWIGDGDVLVEHAFDRFLSPRPILEKP